MERTPKYSVGDVVILNGEGKARARIVNVIVIPAPPDLVIPGVIPRLHQHPRLPRRPGPPRDPDEVRGDDGRRDPRADRAGRDDAEGE